jgi:hypothetical protein
MTAPEWPIDPARLHLPRGDLLLMVDVARQELRVLDGKDERARYPVSTSRFGLGEQVDSQRTPRGLHQVVERFGERNEIGSVFVSRRFTGEVLPPNAWRGGEGDRILSRILRLAGARPGLNAGGAVDTYQRMIYLHGTNHEEAVGVEPSSHGCIRMKNRDMVALVDRVRDREVWCWIG